LISGFSQNSLGFHKADGSGYDFLASIVMQLNAKNPQVASRLLAPLTRWRKIEAGRAALMQQALARIAAMDDLSKDVYEVVTKSLAQ
jgi:aminopeptidase N